MSPAPVTLQPVRSRAELDRFIRVPMRLNAKDAAWISPLISDRRAAFSPKGNPFFAHAEVALWLAVRDGKDVGRISAQIDALAPPDPAGLAGAFGLIAAEDDAEVFAALFSVAEAWLKERGVAVVRGPFNLSINEEVGVLIDGFDTPPMLMMGHDPRYAARQVEAQGYVKARMSTPIPETWTTTAPRPCSSGPFAIPRPASACACSTCRATRPRSRP
jgi:hypothetical protein